MFYYEMYVENNKKTYIYKSKKKYGIGQWCIVNFINKNKMALVISSIEEKNIHFDISKVKYIIEEAPVLSIPFKIMELVKWIKEYYLSDYYNIIKTIYPGVLKLNSSKKVSYIKDLSCKKDMTLEFVGKEDSNENVEKFNEYMKKKKEITFTTLRKNFPEEIIKRAIKEKSIIIEKKLIISDKNIKLEKNKVQILENNINLTEEQKEAINIIKKSNKQFFLLKGITGSGKTEVYIRLIKEAIKEDKGSIFLVPEISLTAQMIERLEREFKDVIAILHSKLSILEKKKEWASIRNGNKKIVIGARSGIFAPVQDLKYIIIDEEHENSYKQDNNPRYHVKNVAIKRALIESDKDEKIKVILGSATPSFESFYQSKNGDLELIELKNRYNNAELPEYKIIDLNRENDNFSKELLEQMALTLKKKEQIILILNRKAFSSLLKCKDCGEIPTCPRCSISMSYYKSDNRLKCNYCGYERLYKNKCFKCDGDKMLQLGSGTEKIEEDLKDYFPDAKIIRIDSESVKSKEEYEKIYNDFKESKYNIMIGTQIISKGFHFPNVTLVGVLNSDIILNFPDFRAGEKTFQLLLQSAGRSGRGNKKGKVLIQTFNEENEIIKRIINNDYEGYYSYELNMRKILNYPPFSRIINIILSMKDEEKLEERTKEFYDIIFRKIKNLIEIKKNELITEPFKATIYKLNGRYRYQIFIKINRENINKIKNVIKKSLNDYNYKDVRISIDVDPMNMM